MKPAPAISVLAIYSLLGSAAMSCAAIARGFCFSGLARANARLVAKSPCSADLGRSSKMLNSLLSGAIVFAAVVSNWVRCAFKTNLYLSK